MNTAVSVSVSVRQKEQKGEKGVAECAQECSGRGNHSTILISERSGKAKDAAVATISAAAATTFNATCGHLLSCTSITCTRTHTHI